jgi:NRAMP (natural resistance-associated macrophage protein)-like metal ion transporter
VSKPNGTPEATKTNIRFMHPQSAHPKAKISIWRKGFAKLEKVWSRLGPGLVTGASDDDPSGIATYSQAGAAYGFGTLWTALLTFPLMAAVQEMCGRIGLVTKHGIAGVVKRHYHPYLIYGVALVTIPACIINIGANLAGMAAVANLLVPQIPIQIFTVLAALAIIVGIVFLPYKKLEGTLKWLALVLLLYLIVPFLIEQDLGEIVKATIIPHIEWNASFLAILVAILGTTISPYLFFWQASMEVEEIEEQKRDHLIPVREQTIAKEVKHMRSDTFVGMLFSNIVMFFILLTAGSVLFKNGIHDIATVEQAAQALKPLAGDFAYILFAVGVIGTGFLSIPVLSGCCSYIISETLEWKGKMNMKLREAKGFYIVIIVSILMGLGMNMLNINPIQALIWTAIVYGLVAPFLIALILHICNNPKIMGKNTNSLLSNVLGGLCFLVMTVAAVVLVITTMWP